MKKRKTKAEYQKYLNYYYADVSTTVFEQLHYLTSKLRTNRISVNNLNKKIEECRCGEVLRKYDPIAFNVGFNDWAR